MIKDMQSPPLSRIQPDFFMKCSLNWYGFLMRENLSQYVFALSPCASNFIFCFAWKILSIGRSSSIIRSQQRVLPLTVPPESPIFFLGVKISLCPMPCSLFSPCFIFVVSLFIVLISVVSLFILPWKFLFFLRLTAELFLSAWKSLSFPYQISQ